MAKPKAPRWLTESFRDGVEVNALARAILRPEEKTCFLAHHDPARRPCEGKFERFHFIGRQRVENAFDALLRDAMVEEAWNDWNGEEGGAGTDYFPMPRNWREEIVLLAAWDPRNGGLACEGHHRRFDDHQVSLPKDRVIVPYSALPSHVLQFAFGYGLDHLLDKFPSSI